MKERWFELSTNLPRAKNLILQIILEKTITPLYSPNNFIPIPGRKWNWACVLIFNMAAYLYLWCIYIIQERLLFTRFYLKYRHCSTIDIIEENRLTRLEYIWQPSRQTNNLLLFYLECEDNYLPKYNYFPLLSFSAF